MELLQNTQTARLVLAYLYNQHLESLAEEFCRKSPYLREELCLLESGDIPFRPFCRPLVQIFSEYNRMCMQVLTLIDQYEDRVSFPQSFSELDKVDMILNFNRAGVTPCLQNVTNISKQSNTSPVIVAYTSQVVKSAVNTTVSIPSEPLARKPNDVPHSVSDCTTDTSADDSVPIPTISLCREELLQLLMCEQDKENDSALSYLLQETAPEGTNGVSEQPNSRPMKEKVTVPQDEMVLPMNQPPLPPTSHVPPTNPSSIDTSATNDQNQQKHEEPVASAYQQSEASAEAAQTGMKEIVAARILGSMAKAGFRSGTQNDTPPDNPIVKDASGGTRSTSSRKRSHIRILDFGTPASKRSSSVPGSADNTETGAYSRKLFAGQGTPASVEGHVSEMPSPATFAMPAPTEVPKVASGHGMLAINAQRIQQISPQAYQVERKHTSHSHKKLNASDTSVTSVATSSETCTHLTGPREKTSLSPAQPLPTWLHAVPESPKQMNRTRLTDGTTVESKPWPGLRGIATPEKKPLTIERTRCATDHQPSSPSKPIGGAEEEYFQHKKGTAMASETKKGTVPPNLQHAALPRASRIATRSSTKKALGDNGISVSSAVTNTSKLPTKDSIPKMAPRPEATGTVRSADSTTNLVAVEAMALQAAHPETPFKIDPLFDYPMTPRFLTNPFLSVSKLDASAMSVAPHREQCLAGGSSAGALSETADINTPGYPITPGAPGTPKSQPSPHSAVCYYRPDEGEAIQPPNETLPGQERHAGQASPAECVSEDFDKMEIVSGGLVFVISSTPLMELYQQEPTTR
uniref:LisH domain-containing protein n=1 Tax=Anopheles atroparvus TaxID=41427 RepID=A0AAG5CPQ1_ANOAO